MKGKREKWKERKHKNYYYVLLIIKENKLNKQTTTNTRQAKIDKRNVE
jgi:hypothetical protein